MRTPLLAFALLGTSFASAHAQNTCGNAPVTFEPEPPLCGDSLAGEAFDGTRAPYSCGEARVFFVDFPMWLRAPDPTAAPAQPAAPDLWAPFGLVATQPSFADTLQIADRFEDRLADAIEQRLDAEWLCPAGPCGDTCRDDAVFAEVHVSALLDERPNSGRRADGHLRFWRVQVRDTRAPDAPGFVVQAGAQADMVLALRDAAESTAAQFGLTATEASRVKVGRQACAVTPAADDTWHLAQSQAMGLGPVPLPELDRPVIAVLDTVAGNNTNHLAGTHGAVSGSHPHGAAMIAFVRQLAPVDTAEVIPHRVIDAAGVGTIDAVARGLDAALFRDQRPLVANLSLAWLPEFERQRRVRDAFDGQPAIIEDGVGASVRYLLAVAGDLDTPQRPVLVVAAAGNRPLDNEAPDVFNALPSYDPCTAAWFDANRSPQLMPAEWSRTTDSCTGASTPILPVGAVDDRGLRGVLSIPDPLTEPRLVAPGQHVADPNGQVWTGSSVSAALASGAAARLLALLRAAGQPLPHGAGLGDLIYALGHDLGRDTLGAVPVHHLALDRIELFGQHPDAHQVIDCVNNGTPATDCLDAFVPALQPAERITPVPAAACDPQINSALSHEACRGDSAWQTALPTDVEVCTGRLAFTDTPRQRRAAMGRVGPQPFYPLPCGDCVVGQRLNRMDEVALHLHFSSAFPTGTHFTDVSLLVYADGKKYYVPVKTDSTAVDLLTKQPVYGFTPGQRVSLEGIQLPTSGHNIDKFALVTTTTQPGKYPALQVSPLYHKIY